MILARDAKGVDRARDAGGQRPEFMFGKSEFWNVVGSSGPGRSPPARVALVAGDQVEVQVGDLVAKACDIEQVAASGCLQGARSQAQVVEKEAVLFFVQGAKADGVMSIPNQKASSSIALIARE